MNSELNMALDDDTKRSLVQYLGHFYRKTMIVFDYREIERLTMIAHLDTSNLFLYLSVDGVDLTLLDSKSFRVINRIREYMETNKITLYS